jgi:hypothetical protein
LNFGCQLTAKLNHYKSRLERVRWADVAAAALDIVTRPQLFSSSEEVRSHFTAPLPKIKRCEQQVFEPSRVLQRLFGLSHAAMAGCSSMA